MPPYRLHDSLGYQLSLAAGIQQRRFDEELRKLGLTRIFWTVLVAVGNEGLEQPSEIADHVGLDRTATSRALRQMAARGLVLRRDGRHDGRTRRIALTEAGRAALDRATPRAEANAAVIEARLTEAERAQLRALLTKLADPADLKPTNI
jgi:DNA-binding MarR family transcriptional regulator